MKKRIIPTIIALVIFIILAVYSNKYEVEDIPAPGEVKPVSILGCNEDDIKSISLGKGGKYDLKFELSSGTSKITSPAEYSCDDAEAFGIARQFAELKSEYLFSDNATDTSIFGINAEAPSIKLETATSVVELTLGNKIAVGTSFYLKKSNDPAIYIVPAYIKGSFEKTLDDLRNRALYSENFGTCNEIQYACGSTTLTLLFNSKNSEWLISNTKYAADSVEVANIINNMRNLRISKFEDGNVSEDKYEINNPNLHINIKNEYGKTYELKAGALQGSDIYVCSDGKTVQMANTLKLNELRLELNDIREKFLETYPYLELTELEVTDATGTIKLVKRDKNWYHDDINIKEADVKDFLNTLSRTKVTGFAAKQDLENLGLNDPEKCQKIILKTADKTKTYWLGNIQGAVLFMMDEDEMIQITTAISDGLRAFMYRVRNAKLDVKK